MTSLDVLTTLAEISIALVGFSGVVSALGRSKLPVELRIFRIRALLFESCVALGASVFPLTIAGTDLDLWFVSGVFFAAVMIINGVWIIRYGTERFKTLSGYIIASICTAFIFMLVGALIFYRSHIAVIYLLSIFLYLALGMYHFVKLVVSLESSSDDGNAT